MITTIVYKNGITSNKISSNMSKIDTIITKTITLKVKTLPITRNIRHIACRRRNTGATPHVAIR